MTKLEAAQKKAYSSLHKHDVKNPNAFRNLTRHYFVSILMRYSILPYSPIAKNATNGRYFRTIKVQPMPLP